ncbi:MAG: sigma-54 dependent transcriptional regulator [Acidobacteria bacterium]|nr:sigma-54 dependent transcriptional regulator [Acidobacteriota bacterium]
MQTIEQTELIVGQSPRMRQVSRLVDKLGKCRWPVLLLGETGTGKEVVARAIHSATPAGPFVTIDCSALVGPLMESELFGHARGAFTGAFNAKLGLIEMANGGTAFFDEIGELPLDLQAKLLRVLQQKEFRPVGSLTQRKSDFRIIAATDRDLAREVERGTFRRDLYYRLNVVNMRLAPLRERKEDIPQLIEHFMASYGRHHTITGETMDAMMSHLVAVNSGPLLHPNDLPSAVQNHMVGCRAMAMAASASGGYTTSPDVDLPGNYQDEPAPTNGFSYCFGDAPSAVSSLRALAAEPLIPKAVGIADTAHHCPVLPLVEIERRAILHALDYTKGDRMMAANLLGIGRTTLYRKLKEYQIAC